MGLLTGRQRRRVAQRRRTRAGDSRHHRRLRAGPARSPPSARPDYAALKQGIEAYVDAVGLTGEAREYYLQNDAAALAAIIEGGAAWPDAPLPASPSLVYAGDADPAHAPAHALASNLPQARFITLPGATHPEAFAASAAILPAVMAFLDESGTT